MLFFRKPSREIVRALLDSQAELGFTYSAVGATAHTPPRLYSVDHSRVILGYGEKTFEAAKRALLRGEPFNVGWVELSTTNESAEKGMIAIVARTLGLWWFNACRVVGVVDEDGGVRKFGITYGTLPRHAGTGEERFLIEWNRDDDSVAYDILSFSRPGAWPAFVGYVWFRASQRRFRRDSASAMRRAVEQEAASRSAS